MFANRIFKGWRKDPVTGKTLLAFEDIPETTMEDALAAIEKEQDRLRKELHADQDRVEGQYADGSKEFPYIKPNKQTMDYRRRLSDAILGYEREKDYLKRIDHLVTYQVLIPTHSYHLGCEDIEELYAPKSKEQTGKDLGFLVETNIEKYLRYVFIDVVAYTSFSIEEQLKIIRVLQLVVWVTVKDYGIQDNDMAFLPTGDGMCIVLKQDQEDIHLKVALQVIQNLRGLNTSPQFGIRVGVNENKDLVYKDINNAENFAGRGINIAQRVMGKAGANQIVVGPTVYDRLCDREAYKGKFKAYHQVKLKHGEKISIYQFADTTYVNFLDISDLVLDD